MIRYMRSWDHRVTKDYLSVAQFNRQYLEYQRAHFPEYSFQLFGEIGRPQRNYLIADFPDLAALERWWRACQADPGYREMIVKSLENLVPGASAFVDGSDTVTLLQSA